MTINTVISGTQPMGAPFGAQMCNPTTWSNARPMGVGAVFFQLTELNFNANWTQAAVGVRICNSAGTILSGVSFTRNFGVASPYYRDGGGR